MRTGPRTSSPSEAPSAYLKSPVDRPRRCKTGRISSTFGERRMYGGRIVLVKRCLRWSRKAGQVAKVYSSNER